MSGSAGSVFISTNERLKTASAFGVELSGVGEHRHQLVVDAARRVASVPMMSLAMRTVSALLLAHEGDGFEPAFQEAAQRFGLRRDGLVGREDHVDVEILQQVVEAEQDAALAALDEIERDGEIDDRRIDRLGAERGDPGGVVADREPG